MLPGVHLTPTEQRIINLLSDGINHTVREMMTCLYDVIGAEHVTVRMHVSNINQKITPAYEILCIKTRGKVPKGLNVVYRLVRNISKSE